MVDDRLRRPVLVLGIGNILLGDEGVGVHVINALRKHDLPDFIELLDGGTAGADLLDAVSDREEVIFIDAMDLDAEPGTVARMKPEDLAAAGPLVMSLHDFGILDTLAMARQLGCSPKRTVVLGVKPKMLCCSLNLSRDLERAMPSIVATVLSELNMDQTCQSEDTPPEVTPSA